MAPRRRSKIGLLFWIFLAGGKNRVKVGHQGVWDPRRRAGGAARSWAALGTLLAALWPPFGLVEASGMLIFYIFFCIFPAYLNIQKPAQKKTTLVALLKTALVRVSFVQIMQE